MIAPKTTPRTWLVTGVSSGRGRALAEAALTAGHSVVGTVRSAQHVRDFEALGKEVAQFGIHVTAIEPGSFRTDWAGRSMIRTERTIDDYDELFGPIRERRRAASGNQLGNPAKAGEAVVHIASVDDPPAHLVLGSDALRLIADARAAVDADIRAWDAVSRSTDFAEGAQL